MARLSLAAADGVANWSVTVLPTATAMSVVNPSQLITFGAGMSDTDPAAGWNAVVVPAIPALSTLA